MGLKLKNNWFYFAVIIFVIALPFSEGLISVSAVLLLLTSLFQLKKGQVLQHFKERKFLLFPLLIFMVYIVWLGFTNDWKWAAYDLKKNIFYLLVPLAFFLAPSLSDRQQKNALRLFVVSVISSSAITLVTFYMKGGGALLATQKVGFIHHIRFSFQLILAMIIILHYLTSQFSLIRRGEKLILTGAIVFLFVFLIWHQSLTGLLSFMATIFFAILFIIKRLKNSLLKRSAYSGLTLFVVLPLVYMGYAINRFYDIDEVSESTIEWHTESGNTYSHNFDNKILENGHYVWLYVCDGELGEAWNKRSEIKYANNDQSGYPVRQTLIRYLTSKGLRKDASGVGQLTDQDVKNIEQGISNYLYADKGISIYPRVYMTIWEIDSYLKTGFANQRSIAQRIEYVKAAITIIHDNFWMGVGTGNWKQAYANAYKKNKSVMDPVRYGDAHNQYLNYMVKFGVIGFILIVFFLIYPLVKTKAYRNPVFLLFLISMVFANLGDSNLETHVGANFFIFFYSFFLASWLSEKHGISAK